MAYTREMRLVCATPNSRSASDTIYRRAQAMHMDYVIAADQYPAGRLKVSRPQAWVRWHAGPYTEMLPAIYLRVKRGDDELCGVGGVVSLAPQHGCHSRAILHVPRAKSRQKH